MHLLFAPLCQNLSKPRNLSYFPLKIRSRPKKGEGKREDLTPPKMGFCNMYIHLWPCASISDVGYALEST